MNKPTDGEDPESELGLDYGQAALTRYYVDIGMAMENLRHATVWLPAKQEFVYNVFVRFPQKESDDHLLIVKAVTEEGPVIAFHGGQGLVSALTTFGTRYRQGKLGWRSDDSPPEAYAKYAKFIDDRVSYLRENGIGQ